MSFQVRAARAAEPNPDSVDAVARITREVLATVVQCPNAVVKAAMTGEAAKLLGLPSAALSHELEKAEEEAARTRRLASHGDSQDVQTDDGPDGPAEAVSDGAAETGEPISGEDAGAAIPPPPKEMALCAFLMANEYDKKLEGMAGELLPRRVFANDFTARFVETWRAEVMSGDDLFAAFAEGLVPRERKWFDAVLQETGKADSCDLDTAKILQDFVRALWTKALIREKGAMPVGGDAASENRRLRISTDAKRLAAARWHDVKNIVTNYMKGAN